jgi:hypothetical protein
MLDFLKFYVFVFLLVDFIENLNKFNGRWCELLVNFSSDFNGNLVDIYSGCGIQWTFSESH